MFTLLTKTKYIKKIEAFLIDIIIRNVVKNCRKVENFFKSSAVSNS